MSAVSDETPDQPGAAAAGPSTPAATAALAQSRGGGAALGAQFSAAVGQDEQDDVDAASPVHPAHPVRSPSSDGRATTAPVEGRDYVIGDGVTRAASGRPYERTAADPVYRPLRVYTVDPSLPYDSSPVAVLNVPYEPLAPGPRGAVIEVDDFDAVEARHLAPADLDSAEALIRQGYDPSPSAPRFHQQMAYAVCATVYATFQHALGRQPSWGFAREAGRNGERNGGGARLLVRPYASSDRNAYYDPEAGELCFGYYRADADVAGRNLPHGYVFTCLSHDVVAHEMSHAMLHGLRAKMLRPTNPDVLAFHEAFADLVALFQRFTYADVVRAAVRHSRGDLSRATLLTALGTQVGETTGSRGPLRDAMASGADASYGDAVEPHARGVVLVRAVFEAFATVFERKAARHVRLATGGSGVLPPGELPYDLQEALAETAAKLASQFLSICIRAIDYCPPVDIEFGEFLRAVITADHDLVPDDPWHYREALIDAFRRHGIYPRDVGSLAEDSLLWRVPARDIPPVTGLSFAKLAFEGDPARPAGASELLRQARELGRLIASPEYTACFGCAPAGDGYAPPCVESVRSSRRVGPDGQVVFDLVAEVTQRRAVPAADGSPAFEFLGGATLILDPRGGVRYAITKRVTNDERLARQRTYVAGDGARFWSCGARELLRLVHDR